MKILILEDKGLKQQKIKRALEQENHNVILCCSVSDFRKEIKKCRYDLVIIDLFVPLENAKKVNENGGYQAIQYIRDTTEDIYRPQNILVISSYLSDERIARLNKLNVKGIQFDNHGEWEEDLMLEIEQISLLGYQKVDIVIITAVDVEMEQIKKALPNTKELDINDEVIYYQADIINEKKEKISVVICQQLRKGMVAAANLTTKAIDMFNPDSVIMLGIAGGNIQEVQYGDIVIASDAIDYCSGSIVEHESNDIEFLPDSQTIPASSLIMRQFRKYKNNTTLLRKIRDDCGDLKESRDISLYIGKMATGPAVIKSKKFTDEYLRKHNRDYLAIDMETFGLYFSARYSQNANIQYVSVKSISDGADNEKNNHYQKYCSRLTANLIKYYIENDYEKVF